MEIEKTEKVFYKNLLAANNGKESPEIFLRTDQFRNNLLTEKIGENHNKKSAIKKISQKILPHNYEKDENKSKNENELQNQRINRIELINKTKVNPMESTDSRENEIDNIRNSKSGQRKNQ